MSDRENESGYYGRFVGNEIVAAGKLSGGTFLVYAFRDDKFEYDPRHQKMYYEGEYDDISVEEFERFKKEMDARYSK